MEGMIPNVTKTFSGAASVYGAIEVFSLFVNCCIAKCVVVGCIGLRRESKFVVC